MHVNVRAPEPIPWTSHLNPEKRHTERKNIQAQHLMVIKPSIIVNELHCANVL